ncbi:putative zonadhesin [Apostichopus japonicus]|uniref:Putative zonadhesin n=1 Tax=Stichopus japonicus TaxID=307972 RepID=A0A2G8KGM9_STIJA|nr:putative zonadhesin [Apostichopus japonicus]
MGEIFYNKSWGVEGITDLPITWCSSNKDNYDNTCERTCENPNDCVRPNPAEPERCLCPENHMIFGDSCIPQEQCGCYVRGEGVVLAEGEFYINSRCTRRSTCSNNQIIEVSYQCSDQATCDERTVSVNVTAIKTTKGTERRAPTTASLLPKKCFKEANYQCSDQATCAERNGVRKCYCNPNYEGDGVTCTHNCFVAAKGSVLREGESYINSDCSLRITCNSNVLTSERYSCGADATCEERNDIRRCYCNEWFEGDGVTCTRSGPKDCSDLYRAGRRNNGKYTIYPAGSSGFEVFCEMSSGDGQ